MFSHINLERWLRMVRDSITLYIPRRLFIVTLSPACSAVGTAKLFLYAANCPLIRILEGSRSPSWAEMVNDSIGKPFLNEIFPSAGILSGRICTYRDVVALIIFL